MKVTVCGSTCTVQHENGDRTIRRFNPGYSPADPNSSLWHAVKMVLNADGGDWVKRRLSSDGHMMGDDATQYLRSREWCPQRRSSILTTLPRPALTRSALAAAWAMSAPSETRRSYHSKKRRSALRASASASAASSCASSQASQP